MIDQLYQKTILKHAANATGHGELENPDHSVTVHNPMCGDRIKIHIEMENQAVKSLKHEAKACALCQASASILGDHHYGLTKISLEALIEELNKSIDAKNQNDNTAWPEKKWEDLEIFKVVRDHQSRRTCVTLPFDALLQALNELT